LQTNRLHNPNRNFQLTDVYTISELGYVIERLPDLPLNSATKHMEHGYDRLFSGKNLIKQARRHWLLSFSFQSTHLRIYSRRADCLTYHSLSALTNTSVKVGII
jgi:hypothetical protein